MQGGYRMRTDNGEWWMYELSSSGAYKTKTQRLIVVWGLFNVLIYLTQVSHRRS
jgi:hypothetical protein